MHTQRQRDFRQWKCFAGNEWVPIEQRSFRKDVPWVIIQANLGIADFRSSLPCSTVSPLRTGTESYLPLKSYRISIQSVFGRLTERSFSENGLFTER